MALCSLSEKVVAQTSKRDSKECTAISCCALQTGFRPENATHELLMASLSLLYEKLLCSIKVTKA